MRKVPAETLLARIPTDVHKVGLVGAAISDHPELVPLLEALVARGHQVSLSSLRADRIARKPRIAELFPKARTVTIKDAAHWVHADRPDAFVKTVQSFLKAIG